MSIFVFDGGAISLPAFRLPILEGAVQILDGAQLRVLFLI